MQSPPPINVAPAAAAASAARETASALEALLEIKHSPSSVLGTPAKQAPSPTSDLGAKGIANPTALKNPQIATAIPIAVHAHIGLPGVVGHVAAAAEGASINQSTGGGTLPPHILAPRHQQPHKKIFLPTSSPATPHSITRNNTSGLVHGMHVLQSTMYPPPVVLVGMAAVAPAGAETNAGDKKSASGATGTTTTLSVREDEIQAALTSKPQRGRKRMNLTAEERKELTKTRNREHARTTRIRKKARNDELLAIEAKYRDLMQKEELDQARRVCVKEFFAIRSEMLARALSPMSNEDDNNLNNDDDTKIVSTSSSLDKVIENQWLFEVSTLAPKRTGTENGIAPLHKFDEVMANSIKSNYPASNVTYNVGTDSLAITNDSALALAEIMDQLTQEIIATITVQFKFGPGLSKIRSLTWSASPSLGIAEAIIGNHHLQAEDAATFPSIVSMHSVSSLDRTSPINGAADSEQETTILRKLSE